MFQSLLQKANVAVAQLSTISFSVEALEGKLFNEEVS
jgi:hypothetical protein